MSQPPPEQGYQVPPQGYPGYPGYPYPVYQQPPLNTMALLSLIFAVAVFPPLGIVFGYVARRQIAERGERGSDLARIGIICGWIFTSIQVVGIAVWLIFVVATFRSSAYN